MERLTLLGEYVQLVFRGMEHELDFASTLPDAISTAKRQEATFSALQLNSSSSTLHQATEVLRNYACK